MKRKSVLENSVEKALAYNKRELKLLRAERRKIRGGKLVNCRRNHKLYFYEKKDGDKVGITRNMNRVYKLGRAQYLDIRIRQLEWECREAEQLLRRIEAAGHDKRIEKFKARFADSQIDIMRMLLPPQVYEDSCRQSQNPYLREELIYETRRGIKMRSKSERSFANLLEDHNIPYQYERMVEVDVTGMEDMKGVRFEDGRGYKAYFPDFTIFRSDGSLVGHEHLGRMDSSNYREKNGSKLIAYLASGQFDLEHLGVSFEDDFRGKKEMELMLQQCILPYA